MTDLERDIAAVLNRHSLENASNSPDWLLAQFLLTCLAGFNAATQQRDAWYGWVAKPIAQTTSSTKEITTQ